ncbi:MobH family relaxase [Undibacterium arcticum]|uniref:MobH family relaxase n=1 Tax=Undibacterium arcticum TaxID=1762892 RepID=UPI00360EFB2E
MACFGCVWKSDFSLQSAERVVFAGQVQVELRRELEPRWRYATFLAALCSELYRPLSDMVVTSQEGKAWPKYLKSLTDWTSETGIDRYFVQWHKARQLHTMVSGRADVAVIMRAILPDYALQYLEDASAEIVPVVFAVASGSSHPADNSVARIVYETRDKISKRDAAVRKENYGKLTVGNHLEPYLLDAMRQLYRTGFWKINETKSRLWYSPEGLFLIWKSAAKEIQKIAGEAGISGVPQDIATLAEILCDGKIAERNGLSSYWMITPPESKDEWQALKIANPLVLIEDETLQPVHVAIRREGVETLAKVGKEAVPKETPIKANKPKAKSSSDDADPDSDRPRSADVIDRNTDLSSLSDHDGEQDLDTIQRTGKREVVPDLDSAKPSKQAKQMPIAKAAKKIEEIDPDAEIRPALVQSSYSGNVAEAARPMLKPDVMEVIGKMIDDYRKGRHKQSILDVPQGIAFENQQVLRYGLPQERIVGLLHANDWLETPAANPNAKNIKVQTEGKTITCIVIKHKAAQFLGFHQDDEC